MLTYQSLLPGGNHRYTKIPIDGFSAGITLKRAGDMPPHRRIAFLKHRGIRKKQIFFCHQIHSRRVLNIDSHQPEEFGEEQADGMISGQGQAVLTVSVADCLPLFLIDKRGPGFGLVHSGWQGTGIATAAVEQLQSEYHSDLKDIAVIIGPGIGSCCYEVPYKRYRLFKDSYGPRTVRKQNGTYFLDLKKTNRLLFEKMGIEDIRVITDCTSCNPALSSFRRDGPDFVHMMAFIQRLDSGRTHDRL